MSQSTVLRAFATVFGAELPDKTMVATIVLVARYRQPLAVWIGAVSAFAVHVTIAVAAGTALSLLPETPVRLVVAALFLVGAALLWRSARNPDQADPDAESPKRADAETDRTSRTSMWPAVAGSFGLIIVAEWGDLTQLATASIAAQSGQPISAGLGALTALAAVAGIAAGFGRQLIARVELAKINYLAAALFATLGLWTLFEVIR